MNNSSSLEEQFNCVVEVVLADFSDIVVDVQLRFTPSGVVEKLRIFLLDESFVDVWLSTSGKYSYHWEQRHVRGLIYRHDNAPHSKWKDIKTFPKHFHDGYEDNVKESYIPDDALLAISYFLCFIRDFLKKHQRIS